VVLVKTQWTIWACHISFFLSLSLKRFFYQNKEQKNWCIIYIFDLLSSAENEGNVFMSLTPHKIAKLVVFSAKIYGYSS